jgi:serine/threonine-protein kinase
VILYELITGTTPFGGEHMAELIFAIISAQPAPLRSRRADVPEGLEHVVARCLAKNRAERFGSIAELANALAPLAPPRALTSVERITGVSTGMYPAQQQATVAINPAAAAETSAVYAAAGTQASWGNTNQRSQTGAQSPALPKSRTPLLVGGLGAAGVLLLGAWLGVRSLSANGATVAASSAAAELTPSARPESPKLAPSVSTATAEATSAPATDLGAASASATASTVASASAPLPSASTFARTKAPPKTKPTPPLTPPGSHDMWGGSQH